MKNTKFLVIFALTALIVFYLFACDMGNGNGSGNDGNNGLSGGETGAFGGQIEVNNAQVFQYDEDTGAVIPFAHNDSMEFVSSRAAGSMDEWLFDIDWENHLDLEISVSIVNNKLSFDTGVVSTVNISPLSGIFTSSTAGVKGTVIESLYYSRYFEDEGYWDESYSFILTNKNNICEQVIFVYVDQDAEITGLNGLYLELSLKSGWNSVKYDYDRQTMQTFSPDNNYIWLTGGNVLLPEDQEAGFRIIDVSAISGTISVTIDGQFPAGGFKLEIRGVEPEILDIRAGSNPVSWEFDIPEELKEYNDFMGVFMVVYPTLDRNAFFVINNLSVQSQGERHWVSDDEFGRGIYEITDAVLQVSVNTIIIPVTVTGFSSNPAIHADKFFYGSFRYGMYIQGSNPHNFQLPDNVGLNVKGENWLWWNVSDSSGSYISKGRLNAALPVSLNIAEMYAE